ncbi:uncharacterized protein LOC133830282 isoform X2 [Humulus lupulus]|uniref:uncharacterized protein LOC133830282 isoform X2 n=1 Tax=Humulus lupulus TaxID=3486 RepID=UPI002B4068F2|nr:uncharacterized protein LOC133830282 isoform X2 [Humulus lupulus]
MAAANVGSSFSCLSAALSSPIRTRSPFQLTLSRGLYNNQQHEAQLLRYPRGKSCNFIHGILNSKGRSPKWCSVLFAVSEEQPQHDGIELVASEQENLYPSAEDVSTASNSNFIFDGTGGKPGLISFYNRSYKIEDKIHVSIPEKNHNSLLWFIGPAVLVASFVFPSLYLRRMLSAIFEDSLLTDFLILFFTEALFYCGVAVFLLLIDHLRRPSIPESTSSNKRTLAPHFGQRISSVAALVLSLIIPMVTMGLVWPWTGPAASATLAPYLVGIVVQFAFEQYARYKKSPSWSVIPIVFQVYRLHQLNRAAQLVTALSFTVRGAEVTHSVRKLSLPI